MSRLSTAERIGLIAVLLLTWGMRWGALMESPPGWRDDDLIELYTFSARILEEGPQIYFPGASGHEPLFHTLRAPVLAVAGINQASARWPSAVAGTLAVLLTWALGRRMFSVRTGLTGAALVAVSFWGLMYSRVAIRHIGALPWMVLALYWGWRQLRDRRPPPGALVGLALGTAGALLTYYAGRLMPVLLIAAWPLVAPRERRWQRYLVGLGLGVALAAPMFWAATHIPGADARVSELAIPIHALLEGDPQPMLQTAWTTLGMFHARGDPEWLYNLYERPVFGPAVAAGFYTALALLIVRLRAPRSRFLLLWLAAGLSPALISLPPSSYGHTILALPAVYLVLASPLADAPFHARPGRVPMGRTVALLLVALVATRDLPAYFVEWSTASMVGFLYRADYRALSRHLQARPEISDATVGSLLFGPWDKVALATDLGGRDRMKPRWADPHRALIFAGGAPTPTYLQQVGRRESAIAALLAASPAIEAPPGMDAYRVAPLPPPADAVTTTVDGRLLRTLPFQGALVLDAVAWLPGADARIATWWTVLGPLPLPEEELIPNPPPPGVYNGPRLKVFAHLVVTSEEGCDDTFIDDGLWVDPYSLVPGDTILQIHHFDTAPQRPAESSLVLGLYDPLEGARWTTPSGVDHLDIPLAP